MIFVTSSADSPRSTPDSRPTPPKPDQEDHPPDSKSGSPSPQVRQPQERQPDRDPVPDEELASLPQEPKEAATNAGDTTKDSTPGLAEHPTEYKLIKDAAADALVILVPTVELTFGFIQVADDPAKLRYMFAVLFIVVAVLTAYLIWRLRNSRHARTRILAPIACGGVLSVGMALVLFINSGGPTPPPGPLTPSGPAPDVPIHDIWASSAENAPHLLQRNEWAMTDFLVTQPYLRSVEVGVGPSNEPGSINKVLLIVFDEHEQEIIQDEASIIDYRAKVTFDKLPDVRAHVGKRLFLQIRNIYPGSKRVYFTKNDRDPSVTSYISCPAPRAIDCPNPQAQDLDARIVGRVRPEI